MILRLYPQFYSYQRRQDARGQHPRSLDAGTGGLLHHGSRVSRFRAALSIPRRRQFLRNAGQVESEGQATLLARRGSFDWIDLRPDRCLHRFLCVQGLRCAAAANPFQRPGNWKDARISDQQLCLASADHHRALPVPLASGVVLQMDKAASSNQVLFWHHRKRREDANLDCRIRLRPGGHSEKTLKHQREPL